VRIVVFLLALSCLVAPAAAQLHAPTGNALYDMSNDVIFRDDALATVQITMAPADLTAMLADPWADVEYPCTMRFTNAVIDETVGDVHIKIHGATSRNSLKKSYRLAFNAVVKGTRFHGVKKLNVIGDQNDVAIVRAKLALDLLRAYGLPSQRAVTIRFRINDGARVNDVFEAEEIVNDDFLDAWFGASTGNLYKCAYQGARADLRYIDPGDAATYQNLGGGQTYAEDINEDNPNYADLAEFIRFINKSTDADFEAGLPLRLNVEGFLRNIAADIALGQWDNIWYGANNYYLYHNPTSDKFEYIPYDYDNTLGIDFFNTDWARRPVKDWGSGGFGSGPDIPPIMRRILKVPAWEAQLRRYVRRLVGAPARLPSTPFPDTAGDTFNAATDPHFDILRADVSNDDAALYLTVRVAGPIDSGGTTDQVRFCFFLDTKSGGATTNPWGRSINSTAASDFFIGAWTNGGGGFTAYRANANGTWSQVYNSNSNGGGIVWDLSGKGGGVAMLSLPLSFLGLSSGAGIQFDVATANIRGTTVEPCVDHLSNPALATPDYETASTPGPFVSYTLQTTPGPDDNAPFSIGKMGPQADRQRTLALPYAYRGSFAGPTMDWNWTPAEFAASFDSPTSYVNPGRPWNWGIKPYISARAAWLAANTPMPAPLPRVTVNEVLSLNSAVNRDENGAYSDWVELYNAEPAPVDLGGMFLTDTPLMPRRWRIPDGTAIPAGGFLLFWADGQPGLGGAHAGFTLSSGGATVALYDRDSGHNLLVDSLDCPATDANVSYGRYPDGSATAMAFTTVTPRAANSNVPTVITHKPVPNIVINEFMASNSTTIADENGDHDDWIELYNAGVDPVDMGGRYLTDSLANRTKFRFPAGIVIPSGGYLIVWADDEPAQGPLHAPYKLSASGEQIGLFDRDDNGQEPIDTTAFGAMGTDISIGRPCDGEGSFVVQPHPTPGAANAGSCTPAAPTITEQPRGRQLIIGNTAGLSVSVTGAVPMTFRWRKDNKDIAIDDAHLLGANTRTLTFSPVTYGDAGRYDVVIQNAGGPAVSDGAQVALRSYTMGEASIALQIAAGLTERDLDVPVLDADNDGQVTVSDAIRIVRLAQ
jgi:spore coat protein CotH